MTAVVEPASGTLGFHPEMFPVRDANRKRAAPLAVPEVKTKSFELLATAPVGRSPGILIDGTVGCLKKTMLPESPRYRLEVLVPLFANQNGLLGDNPMPQGLTTSGSSMAAIPGKSDTR